MKSNGVCIPKTEQDAVHQIFYDYLSQHRIALKGDLASAVADRGLTMEDHRLSYHIRLAEYSGLLCSGDYIRQKNSYALTADKLPCAVQMPHEEALVLLTRKYFRSHGPAWKTSSGGAGSALEIAARVWMPSAENSSGSAGKEWISSFIRTAAREDSAAAACICSRPTTNI